MLQQGALLRAMSSGVMMLSDQRIVRCNLALEGILGLESRRIVGRPVVEVLDCEPPWDILRHQFSVEPDAPADAAVMVRVRRSGGEIVCAMQVRPVDPDSPGSLIVTLQDITEIPGSAGQPDAGQCRAGRAGR